MSIRSFWKAKHKYLKDMFCRNRDLDKDASQWTQYSLKFVSRFCEFIKNPILVVYFFIIVAVVGSFGVWYPFLIKETVVASIHEIQGIMTNLATYTISLLSGTMAHLLLGDRPPGKGFRILSLSLFLLGLLSSVATLLNSHWIFAIFGVLTTYILWIVVYAQDEQYTDKQDRAAVGGAEPQSVILNGNIDGYQQ